MNFGKYKVRLFIRLVIFVLGLSIFLFNFMKEKKYENITNGNIIFVLDVSNSMNVNDVFYNSHKVSRLKLAKKIIENNVKKYDRAFGLILFSDKIDYFIPPTLDKDTFLIYLNTVNTNNLNGGKTNFVKSLNSLNKVLNPTDVIILLSDFDINENISDIKLKNYIYSIGLGTKSGGIVKNNENKTLYLDGNILKSSLNENKLIEFSKLNDSNYKIISSYKKGEILSFIKDMSGKNIIEKNNKINYYEILGFVLIILAL